MTVPLVALAFFAVTAGWVNWPGVYTGFTTWVATRIPLAGMGDHHPEGLDWSLVIIVTPVVLVGVAVGWWVYGRKKEPQAERDTFRIPVLWPLFENLYYIPAFYMNFIVRPIMGPIASVVLWWDMYVIDGFVNLVGLGSLGLAQVVRVFDQNVVDGFYNELGAGVEGSGSGLRLMFTGRVQQYAAFSFIGVVVIAVLFIIL